MTMTDAQMRRVAPEFYPGPDLILYDETHALMSRATFDGLQAIVAEDAS